MKGKIYKKEENDYIILNYRNKSIEEISLKLGRTKGAVLKQIERLKKKGKIHEKDELKSLLKRYMISKKNVIKEEILEYEKYMIAGELKITIKELEIKLKNLKKEYIGAD